MSHKTLLKRFRGEASTSTAAHQCELEQMENTSTPIELAEPDEPDPESEDPVNRLFSEEIKIYQKRYSMPLGTFERRQKKYEWSNQCLNCVKRLDDVVRKVHNDLLSGRITMVGVTLTRKLPIKTRNRRTQTSPDRTESPERMESSPERVHTSPERVHSSPERVPTRPTRSERMQTSPGREQARRKRRQSSPERARTRSKWRRTSPEQMQTILKRAPASPEPAFVNPKRMHTNSKRVDTSPDRMQTSPKRVHANPRRIHTTSKRVHTSPERMQPKPKRQHTSPERWVREPSLTRDFCGGTDPSILEGGCQCNNCLIEHNASANYRATRSKSRHHLSRIHRNRAHFPCKDDALTDLHQHVLAGDKKTPGSMYVDILASLHAQGPCEEPCKLRADVIWMNDHIPKQAETQTDLTGDAGVRDQGTQTNLTKSVGIQNGDALARLLVARAARFKSRSIQIDLPNVPNRHRPVCNVLPFATVIRNRF